MQGSPGVRGLSGHQYAPKGLPRRRRLGRDADGRGRGRRETAPVASSVPVDDDTVGLELRLPKGIEVIRPLRRGVVADVEAATYLISSLMGASTATVGQLRAATSKRRNNAIASVSIGVVSFFH